MDDLDKERETRKTEFLGTKKHMRRGLSFFKKGEYQLAIEQFELILLHDKSYVRAHNNLGYIYRMLGDYDKALEVWKKGLEVNASYRRLQKNISSLQRFLKSKHEKAGPPPVGIEDFEVGVEWLSENAELIEIREGSLFDIYVVEDDGVRHAFKTPMKPLSANREILRAFEQACSGWLQLGRNEYVAHAHSLEWVSGQSFLALEYMPEGSLRGLLERAPAAAPATGGPRAETPRRAGLSLGQTLELALQLCVGVHFIHTKLGAPHGDIRPENIMLSRPAGGNGGRAIAHRPDYYFLKIADIGQWAVFERAELFCDSEGKVLSELAGEGLARTPSGFLTASMHSCAPELLNSLRAPNVSTDVYAFGVVLYEMLTGMLPFSGSGTAELAKRISESRPEHPSVINPRIPPQVGSISMRCLERNPEARFSGFLEIADALIKYLDAAGSALSELHELCKRYKKISRLQFRDDERNTSVMIVGGTEFSSEVGQIWEILNRRAETERDAELRKRLARIEDALLVPGLSIGALYPTTASLADGITLIPPETYRDELNALRHAGSGLGTADGGMGDGPAPDVSVEPPDDRVCNAEDSASEVFRPGVAEEYASLLRAGDPGRAARLLADGLKFRAETLLLQSSNGPDLLSAFESVARSESFHHWLGAVFEELPSVSASPRPEDFLREGMEAPEEIIAAISGLLLMQGGEYAAALEAFNMIPDELWLPALDIYLWTMAKFQSQKMEEIRLNSLKNASGLLREIIIANKKSNKRSTIVLSTHPTGALADAFFLRALVLEQLDEHRHAIAHFRAWKKLLHAEPGLSQKNIPWADMVQGKCMHELGMPSEGFMRWQRMLTQELDPPFFSFLELGVEKPRVLLAKYLLPCCSDAISRYADTAMLWCVKGKLLSCSGQPADAVDCSHRAAAIEENFYPAYFVRMEAMLSMEQHEEALDALRVCTIREPYEPLFMLREAEILCRLSEPEKAFIELKKAIAHGLDLSELTTSIQKKRLAALEGFDDFKSICAHLGRA